MDITKRLRRALVGGFNSRDVVAYIDRLTEQHRSETSELERELERTRAELEEARRTGGDAEEARRGLDETSAALGERTEELARVTEERDSLSRELEESKERLRRFENADAELAEKLGELERVKARITDIELEAYERARRIEGDAAARAEELRAESEALLRDACRRYGGARDEASRAVGDGLRALDALRRGMEELLGGFEEIGERLSAIDPGAPEERDGAASAE